MKLVSSVLLLLLLLSVVASVLGENSESVTAGENALNADESEIATEEDSLVDAQGEKVESEEEENVTVENSLIGAITSKLVENRALIQNEVSYPEHGPHLKRCTYLGECGHGCVEKVGDGYCRDPYLEQGKTKVVCSGQKMVCEKYYGSKYCYEKGPDRGCSRDECFRHCAKANGCTGIEYNTYKHKKVRRRCELSFTPVTQVKRASNVDCFAFGWWNHYHNKCDINVHAPPKHVPPPSPIWHPPPVHRVPPPSPTWHPPPVHHVPPPSPIWYPPPVHHVPPPSPIWHPPPVHRVPPPSPTWHPPPVHHVPPPSPIWYPPPANHHG